MAIGWFGEDWVDAGRKFLNDAGDAASDAASSAWDLVDDLPGLKQLGEGVKGLATSELFRDFAKSSHGQLFFRAIATAAGQGVGGLLFTVAGLGPLTMLGMASVHALPGVIRGQRFGDAFLAENMKRVEDTAKIVGTDAAAALPAQWQQALEELQARAAAFAPTLEPGAALDQLAAAMGTDAEGLARRIAAQLGIREDMAGQALSLILDRPAIDSAAYDPVTGRKYGAAPVPRFFARSRSATVRNEQIARVLEAYDPARKFRAAARSTSTTAANTSSALAFFREARGVAPAAAAADDRDRFFQFGGAAEPGPDWTEIAIWAALAGGAFWYLRRRA